MNTKRFTCECGNKRQQTFDEEGRLIHDICLGCGVIYPNAGSIMAKIRWDKTSQETKKKYVDKMNKARALKYGWKYFKKKAKVDKSI